MLYLNRIWQRLKLYGESKIQAILFLGFSSGLPFLLTLATFHVWLSESGVDKTSIGLFVLVTIPYSLKFLWAPFLDHYQIPILYRLLGKRRSWLIVAQVTLIIALIILGSCQPDNNLWLTAGAAFFVAFAAATQDIIIEAFRAEYLDSNLLGPGVGASSLGYRLGMWVSGAGALYLASFFSWQAVYTMMACCVVVGIATTLLITESKESSLRMDSVNATSNNTHSSFIIDFKQRTSFQFMTSFRSMLQRDDLKMILLFIFCYKIGDTVLNTMTMPFLIETGFSKLEIAHVAKSFGMTAMVIGGLIGGGYLTKGSLAWALTMTACLQIIASLMFWIQAETGHNITMLFFTIGIENFASGFGNTAFIVYLSSRCRMPFTATHYAILSSFGSLCRVTLSSTAGWAADYLPWTDFYSFTAALCIPALLVTFLKSSSFEQNSDTIVTVLPDQAKAEV